MVAFPASRTRLTVRRSEQFPEDLSRFRASVDVRRRDGSLEGHPILPDSGSDGARIRIAAFIELPPSEATLEPTQETELRRTSAPLLDASPGGPPGTARDITVAVDAFDSVVLDAVRGVSIEAPPSASLDAIVDATTSGALDAVAGEGMCHWELEVEGASRKATPEAILEITPASNLGADFLASTSCAPLGGEFWEHAKISDRVPSLLVSSINSVAVPDSQVKQRRHVRTHTATVSVHRGRARA